MLIKVGGESGLSYTAPIKTLHTLVPDSYISSKNHGMVMTAEENVSRMLGDHRRAIRGMACSLLIALVVAEANTFVDRAWCSGLGYDALAAIAVVAPVFMVITSLGNGLGVGVASTIAWNLGSGDVGMSNRAARQALLFAIVFGAIISPILVLTADWIITTISTDDISDLAVTYYLPYAVCAWLLIINGTLSGMMRGEGAVRVNTTILCIMAVSNMILDPVFIYVLDLGLTGASIATMVSCGVSVSLGLWYFLSGNSYLRLTSARGLLDTRALKPVLHVGVPQMTEYAIMYAMNVVLNHFVLVCGGAVGLTVYSVPNTIMSLVVIPAMAIGSALVSVASSAYGQGDMERMHSAFQYSVRLAVGVVTVLTVVVFLVPEPLLSLFTYSGDTVGLRDQMEVALRIYCLYIPFFALIPVGSSMLQSLGMPNKSVVQAIVRNLLLIALYAIASTHSLEAIFWAVVIGEVIGGIMMHIVARRSFMKVVGNVSVGV